MSSRNFDERAPLVNTALPVFIERVTDDTPAVKKGLFTTGACRLSLETVVCP